FKAVMGHEFGHFSQKTTRLGAYIYIAMQAMDKAIMGPQWLRDWVASARRDARAGSEFTMGVWLGLILGGISWLVSNFMGAILHLLVYSHSSLSRKQEFHADRVGVSVAGSNAMVHSLYRIE